MDKQGWISTSERRQERPPHHQTMTQSAAHTHQVLLRQTKPERGPWTCRNRLARNRWWGRWRQL